MKLFGWGKNKDPQPQVLKKSDPRFSNRGHGMDRGTPGMGPIMPGKGCTSGVRKQQGLFGVDDEGYLHNATTAMPKQASASATTDDADLSDEKLQDTIRFVFSHEQEGLLAIGTFALEQLQSIRNTIDGHQKSDDLESSATPYPDLMQSSDDEDQLQRSWLAARRTCELPVFGDVETSGVESETDGSPRTDERRDQSKALTLYKNGNGNRTPVAGVKPIVLLTALPPELRKALDPASALLYGRAQLPNLVPHWTNSVAPPVVAKPEGPRFADEDYYSSRLCGLFSSKKKPPSSEKSLAKRSTQREIVPVPGDDKKRIIPIERAEEETKKSILKTFGSSGMPALGKLAKMWRATCKQSSARIVPERKPCSPKGSSCIATDQVASGEVLTPPPVPQPQVMRPSGRLPAGACSPKVAEFRKRVQMHERTARASSELRDASCSPSRDGSGHWIKTDEDFLVLEM